MTTSTKTKTIHKDRRTNLAEFGREYPFSEYFHATDKPKSWHCSVHGVDSDPFPIDELWVVKTESKATELGVIRVYCGEHRRNQPTSTEQPEATEAKAEAEAPKPAPSKRTGSRKSRTAKKTTAAPEKSAA